MTKHVILGAGLALFAASGWGIPAIAQESTATATAETTAAAPAPEVPEGGANAVVATVNGTNITLGHMLLLHANLPPQYKALPSDVLYKAIMDQLIQQAALTQSVEGELRPRDIIAIENERRSYLSGVALAKVISGAVTDESLQKAYDEKFADAEPTKEYHAAHILVKTEEEAKDIRKQIADGADFAEMAKKYSTDGAAQNGGDLSWFGQGMMVPQFEEAVMALQPGQISDPVQTQFGWHLIDLKETRIAEAPTLDEMREELAGEIEQATVEAYIAELTEKAKITRPGEKFDPALLNDTSLLDQ